MTTTVPVPPLTPATRGPRLRRFSALVRAETRMLLRNRTAVFTALILPLGMAGLFGTLSQPGMAGVGLALVLICTGLLFVVYYTMVTALVARREHLVLNRLRAGEPTPLEILLAPAVPLWAILVVQSTLGLGLAVVVLGAPVAHWWATPVAVVGGATAWTALAVWSTTWTRTVESAQLTTLPLMLVSIMLSGLSFPLSLLPDPIERVAHALPMTLVVDLVTLGFTGRGIDGRPVDGATGALAAAAVMVLPLVGWTALAGYQGLRAFRWDARS